ncbi:type III secretion system needle filament subunit SctF [Pleionea sediminis]|uniref:type III secretion system needle filament subunit SctF n=1 Tax=Pleionea sediminis TaxID=2569479 RepID=UPI0011852596|nr:type III secretion system needle filament subunit SctF [Pleionea sediminis]
MAYTDINNGFTITTASQNLSPAAERANNKLNEAAQDLATSPDDPAKLANFNAAVSEWTVIMNLVSSIQKNLKDVMSSIVQKM